MTQTEYAKDMIKGLKKCYYCKYRIDSNCGWGGVFSIIHSFNNSCEHFESDDYYVESGIIDKKDE
jgi:hypothetical protein